MDVLVWSPTVGWNSTNFSPHYYLFKTQYQHYGRYPDDVKWLKFGDITAEEAIEQITSPLGAVFLGIYPWNKIILLDFVKYLESRFPDTPIFFGGVEIDFSNLSLFREYKNVKGLVKGEGEVPLTQIIDTLYEKRELVEVPGLWIKQEDYFIQPKQEAPRIKFKDGIGPKDGDFFEVDYSYLIENSEDIFNDIKTNYNNIDNESKTKYFFWESTRGCPYGCVYCDWGGGINTKVRRKPTWMIEQELDLIFKNLDNFFFHLFDANFGIFPQDIDTAQYIADLLKKYNKVGKIDISITFAKNNQDNVARIIEILNPVKSSMPWSLDIQSTDPGVLEDIKRTQAPMKLIAEKYKIKENKSKFYTNAMLALPGTTLEKDFKTWCDILDAGSQVSGYITTIPPQSEMLSPQFVKQWNVKTFTTGFEHATINHLNYNLKDTCEIIYMHSCNSFSTEEYIDILMMFEIIQLLDGCYITKFARLLAGKNGYGAYDFYKPIFDKFLLDESWLGVNINDIRQSIRNWIFNNQPFGIIKETVFADTLLKRLIYKYYFKNLKEDLLLLVGHMDKQISTALDIGFATLPTNNEKTYKFDEGLVYVKNPSCELDKIDYQNTVVVTPTVFRKDSIHDVSSRMMNPVLLDNIINNYRP